MKVATITNKEGHTTVFVTVECGTREEPLEVVEAMTLGEWSRLIANPIATQEH